TNRIIYYCFTFRTGSHFISYLSICTRFFSNRLVYETKAFMVNLFICLWGSFYVFTRTCCICPFICYIISYFRKSLSTTCVYEADILHCFFVFFYYAYFFFFIFFLHIILLFG